MRTALLIAVIVLLQPRQPEFESATIKPTGHFPEGCNLPDMSGGPGTATPSTLTIPAMRPIDILTTAFQLRARSILGLDRFGFAWNGETVYTITAKIRRDAIHAATKEEIAPMLKQLLVSRFHLAAHRETQQLDAYELTVAPAGIRLTKSPGTHLAPIHHSCQGRLDRNGFPSTCPGCAGMAMTGVNGITRIGARYVEFADLVGELSDLLGRPVLDKTSLTGRYDFTLEYPWEGLAGPGGVNGRTISTDVGASRLADAVLKHLGLILKPVKAPVEVLVVDHLDEHPTAN